MADEVLTQDPTELATTDTEATVLGDVETQTEDAAQDAPKQEVVVPEKYEFVIEGMDIDAKAVEAFSPALKEIGLTQEQAQKLAEVYAKQRAEDVDRYTAFHKEMRAEADKIPTADVGLAKQAIKYLGADGKALAEDVYIGNNPAVIKALAKLGKLVADGQFHEGTEASGMDEGKMLAKLYPSMNQ